MLSLSFHELLIQWNFLLVCAPYLIPDDRRYRLAKRWSRTGLGNCAEHALNGDRLESVGHLENDEGADAFSAFTGENRVLERTEGDEPLGVCTL